MRRLPLLRCCAARSILSAGLHRAGTASPAPGALSWGAISYKTRRAGRAKLSLARGVDRCRKNGGCALTRSWAWRLLPGRHGAEVSAAFSRLLCGGHDRERAAADAGRRLLRAGAGGHGAVQPRRRPRLRAGGRAFQLPGAEHRRKDDAGGGAADHRQRPAAPAGAAGGARQPAGAAAVRRAGADPAGRAGPAQGGGVSALFGAAALRPRAARRGPAPPRAAGWPPRPPIWRPMSSSR